MSNLVHGALKAIRVENQSGLNLSIRQSQVVTIGDRIIVDGRGFHARYDQTGTLHIRTASIEDDTSEWITYKYATPSPKDVQQVGVCTVLLAARHSWLDSIRVTGENMRLEARGLKVGRFVVDRRITEQPEPGSGGNRLNLVTINDCEIDDFSAHLTRGRLKIENTTFTDPAKIVGHLAACEVGVYSGEVDISLLPTAYCGPACVAVRQ